MITNDEKSEYQIFDNSNDKKVRVNSQYGEWYYEKEVDMEDKDNYMYYFYGKDKNKKDWSWSTPYYHEMIDFIKSDDDTKNTMQNW